MQLVNKRNFRDENPNKFPGNLREEGTPGPIPNPEVKLFIANDTALI